MKDKRIASGILFLLLTFASFLIFFIYKDAVVRNVYRTGFFLLFEIMAAYAVGNFYFSRRKANRNKKLVNLGINLLFISFGMAFLFFSKSFHKYPEVLSVFSWIKKIEFMSGSFSSVLILTAAFFIIYNYLWIVRIQHLDIKKHVVPINLFFITISTVIFALNISKFNVSGFVIFGYAYLLFSIPLNYFMMTISESKKNQNPKIIYQILLILSFVVGILLLFYSNKFTGISKNRNAFHVLIPAIIGLNQLFGLSGYALLKKESLKKYIKLNLASAITVIALITWNLYSHDYRMYIYHFLSTSILGSLWIAGSLIIFSKKNYIMTGRILAGIVFLLLTAGSIYFQHYGPALIKSELFSFQVIVSNICAILFNLSYVFLVLTFINSKEQAANNRKKSNRKKKNIKGYSETVKPPFEAYKGKGKFVFVSYSHRNMPGVFSIIKKLFDKGYKIWYDEGIEPGDEWPETIGKAIDDCHKFIVFMSKPASKSRNVRNEINFAFNKKKNMTVVMLEKTSLTHGLDLQIGTVQSINKFSLSEKEFYQKIDEVLK